MMKTMLVRVGALAMTVGLFGCADKIGPDEVSPDARANDPIANVTTTRAADGTYTTVINSTSDKVWIHTDFETGAEVEASAAWDLRFQRFHISANGGVSGTGGVEVAAVDGTFDSLTAAPTDGWITDVADDNADMIPEYVFDQAGSWYDYNSMTHVLTPKAKVWAIRMAGGGPVIKLEIQKYYDGAGTSGWFTLRWRPL